MPKLYNEENGPVPMYKDALLEHYKCPRNRSVLASPTAQCQLLNPSCGDQVAVQLILENGIITAVGMQARGCVVSVAAASLLSEALVGMNVPDVRSIDVLFMHQLTGLSLGPVRQNCMMLCVQAVHKALGQSINY